MTAPAKPRRRRGAGPEAAVERQVIAAYRAAGITVYKLSQGFRPEPGGTRQTPGIPDLECWHAGRRLLVKHAVKTPAGEREHQRLLARKLISIPPKQMRRWHRAQAQQQYADLCARVGIPYARGGVSEALALLTSLGLLEARS
ncbi:MAG: hypothetical protein AB7N73_16185 [Gemmatimonadales bacterium]